MRKTKIEYLTHIWNPIAMKCDPVSIGCENCWHLAAAKRLAVNPVIKKYKQKAYMGACVENNDLAGSLLPREPAVIGVQFMGDLFHDSISKNNRIFYNDIVDNWRCITRGRDLG